MAYQNNLKQYRIAKKLSQQAVADKVGIVIRLYQYYEAGEREPAVHTAIKIAQILGVSVEDLFPIDTL